MARVRTRASADSGRAARCGSARVCNRCRDIRLERLPRMADFALWAAACETAAFAVGTFEAAYWLNRRAAIEDVIDADPVAACVRHLMSQTTEWTGSASELLNAGFENERSASYRGRTNWPKNPRALAGRLRRAQTFLRALGIEMAFAREGRAGTRIITIHAAPQSAPPGQSRATVRGGWRPSGHRSP